MGSHTVALTEGKANTHLTHLEELVLTQGPQGYEMARAFLLELLETLKGNSNSRIQTSVKWDGAPAIFAGVNPENGEFFVGTKSIFNKVPKINYTEEDILKNHGHAPGLVDKLTKALKYLPQLGITNILQGDFMFDDEMLDVVDIDGEPHYRFKPNTIVYAVPVDSELGQEIGQSKFGIVFHTTYDSLDGGASFGADISNLRDAPGVWFDDAFFTDDTGIVTLTENEESRIISLVEKADAVNSKIDYNELPMPMLNIYINSEIKAGQFLEDPEDSFEGFLDWYRNRSDKAIEKLKTQKGRLRRLNQQHESLLEFVNKREDILNLFRVSRLLFEAKNIFIEKYNNAVYNTKHFVDDGSGDLVATNPEGYVAVDHEGNGVKFVDRLEFSRANFLVDKSAKFVQENLSNFTIRISKDRQVTKTIAEWLEEIKRAGHTYQKPPQLVYKDIMAGTPIVEIVSHENAAEAIYNTVITYINNLHEQEEDEDPVVDIEFEDEPVRGETVAIVPGAYKPPHMGHVNMVEQYAQNADRVIVLISAPTRSGRKLPNGREITAEDSEQIWNLFVGSNPKVEVYKSMHASPINAAYEITGKTGLREKVAEQIGMEPLSAGDTVILGASNKGGDAKRWTGAKKYVGEDLQLIDPMESAVEPLARPNGEPFSATDMRKLLGDTLAHKDALRDFAGDNVDDVLRILGMQSLEEMSAMGAGAVGGSATGAKGGPWNAKEVRKDNEEEKERSTLNIKNSLALKKGVLPENIDLSMVDEVMRLIMTRGIL
jgi:cytidyltransferase-like protein